MFIEKTYRQDTLDLANTTTFNLSHNRTIFDYLKKTSFPISDNKIFTTKLKKHIAKYDYFIAIDFLALDILSKLHIQPKKIIYISLEGIDYLEKFDKQYALLLLKKTKVNIIQNKERAIDICNYLDAKINFKYIPVSLRPTNIKKKMNKKTNKVKLIYSGYFAPWALLGEFLCAYKKSKIDQDCILKLQGHALGTSSYLNKLKQQISALSSTTIDTSYYNDQAHMNLISQYDIGIALYDENEGSNFKNLLNSSGKIASYLWNGLAVMTNIKHEMTLKPPFLYVEDLDSCNISTLIKKYQNSKERYISAAYALAKKSYNFDHYLKTIIKYF
ncbi:hypothetical protein GYA49_05135 [Candidatus Beckwithbacteria bacterium]|nr:hypothetical protein [Candidatus Beckwithbacteria bacterium]